MGRVGFFGNTGSYAQQGEFETAEEGVYTARLKEVLPETRDNFDDPTIKEEVYRFVFETTEANDSQGNPYKFVSFTKRSYGNEKANLTKIIDGMVGRHLTIEEYNALDLDELTARKYKVMVTEHTTGTGRVVNKIMSVKPAQSGRRLQPNPVPAVEASEDELNDPFANE